MSTNAYPVFFNATLLSDTLATIYTASTGFASSSILQDMELKVTNSTDAVRLLYLYAVPSGGTASSTNEIVSAHPVPARDYVILPVERLAKNGTIQGYADVDATLTVSPIGGKIHTP